MPGPRTVYGEALAAAVRAGEVEEAKVDEAVRNVLRLAARVGVLEGAEPVVTEPPATVDGEALAREIARRSFVLVRNQGALPLGGGRGEGHGEARGEGHKVALIGAAARDARILGGGSATVFPARVVPPLDGLTAALPEGSLTYAVGADPNEELAVADRGSPCGPSAATGTARSSAPARPPTARSSGWATTSPRASPTPPSTASN